MVKRLFKYYFIIVIFLATTLITTSGQQSKKSGTKKSDSRNTIQKFSANYGKYNFTIKTLDGKTIQLSDYAGKVVLVNIWAPWCPPCKKETPGFIKLYEKYHKKGFEIIGVAVQTNETDVRAFIEKYKIDWQVGIKDEIAKAFGTYGIPDSYLFQHDGTLIKEFIGYASEELLQPLIENALTKIPEQKH